MYHPVPLPVVSALLYTSMCVYISTYMCMYHPVTQCQWPSSVLCFCVSARAWLIRVRGGGGVPGRRKQVC